MNILQKGILPLYKGTCDVCGCVITAEHGEHAMMRMDNVWSMSFKCPTPKCESHIRVYPIQSLIGDK